MPEDCSVCCQQAKEKRRSLNAIFQLEANSAILTLLTVIWPALSSELRKESQQCSLFGCRKCFQLLQTASNHLGKLKESVDQVEDVLQQSGRFWAGFDTQCHLQNWSKPRARIIRYSYNVAHVGIKYVWLYNISVTALIMLLVTETSHAGVSFFYILNFL